MSSVTARTSQIPSIVGYFKTDIGSDLTYIRRIDAPLSFTVGSGGVTSISGTNVYFNTYANAQTALTTVGGIPGDGELYRDMGKTYSIFVQQEKNTGGYIYNKVAELTKVQRYISPGQISEGVTGAGTTAGNSWQCYYFVTWSANSESSTGIPVGLVRTGYQ